MILDSCMNSILFRALVIIGILQFFVWLSYESWGIMILPTQTMHRYRGNSSKLPYPRNCLTIQNASFNTKYDHSYGPSGALLRSYIHILSVLKRVEDRWCKGPTLEESYQKIYNLTWNRLSSKEKMCVRDAFSIAKNWHVYNMPSLILYDSKTWIPVLRQHWHVQQLYLMSCHI